MVQYPALLDGEAGAYGVVFHDLPGCEAMSGTVDEALRHATAALHDYVATSLADRRYHGCTPAGARRGGHCARREPGVGIRWSGVRP